VCKERKKKRYKNICKKKKKRKKEKIIKLVGVKKRGA
jgi:hypothetical protein